jgi:acyl dehydratase
MGFDFSRIGKRSEPLTFTYSWKDVVLYHLGIGARADELDFLLETAGPKVYPTFAVVPTFGANLHVLSTLGGNLLTVVHGAQRIALHRPIPPEGTLRTTATVTGIFDKGKGALAIVRTETQDAAGRTLFDTEWQIFYRGEGGFGGERGPEAAAVDIPARDPDFREEQTTADTQSLLYRLSGDVNPIHASPDVARMAGFPRPILHGLCTFGFVGRAAVRHACGGDPALLKVLEARFAKLVFPGDTLVTEGWNAGPRTALRVTTRDRQESVLTHAFVERA